MSSHNFQPLFDRYPAVIAELPNEFTSHEFLQRLTQQSQSDYVEALYSYRDDEPFRKVHGRLAQQLHKHKDLIEEIDEAPSSINIFGDAQICAHWRKVV
jgi:hypothetical protein